MNMYKKQGGFTLIELMVVIAIIGLLASVILASLSTARKKSKDSVIRQEVIQMRNLLELEYSTSGNYTNLLNTNFITYVPTCNSFAGTYATKATDICNKVVQTNSGTTPPGTFNFYVGPAYVTQNSNIQIPGAYSIIAWLPYKGIYLCLGSNGRTSETLTYASTSVLNPYDYPPNDGCPVQTPPW
jgi:prepilin-type N-terminal cleavage/methylation domain-containing protein